jgi:quercetin dioxygenase-like cupin family protein
MRRQCCNGPLVQARPAGPKLTQLLRKDLENQGSVVQETVVSIVEFGPGSAAPWHMHPGAQELLQVIEVLPWSALFAP